MKLILIASILVFASGCVSSPIRMLVHPDSGMIIECTATGNVQRAETYVKNCADQYEALGYIPAERLTEDQKKKIKPAAVHRSSPVPQPREQQGAQPYNRTMFCTQTGPGTSSCY